MWVATWQFFKFSGLEPICRNQFYYRNAKLVGSEIWQYKNFHKDHFFIFSNVNWKSLKGIYLICSFSAYVIKTSSTKVFGTHIFYEGGGGGAGFDPTPNYLENVRLYKFQLSIQLGLSIRGKKQLELMI